MSNIPETITHPFLHHGHTKEVASQLFTLCTQHPELYRQANSPDGSVTRFEFNDKTALLLFDDAWSYCLGGLDLDDWRTIDDLWQEHLNEIDRTCEAQPPCEPKPVANEDGWFEF